MAADVVQEGEAPSRMLSIRLLSIILNVAVVGTVSMSLIVIAERTADAALQSCEDTMQSGVGTAFASGEANVRKVTEQLMDRSAAQVVSEIHAYLAPLLALVRGQAAFAAMHGVNATQKWSWMSESWRPILWNAYKQMWSHGVSSLYVWDTGGDPLAPGRTHGPHYMFLAEDQKTATLPKDDDHYHYLFVLENDGSPGRADWGRLPESSPHGVTYHAGAHHASLIAERPIPEGACVAMGTPDPLGRIDRTPLPEPSAPPPCTDALPTSPACQYGGMCDCAEATVQYACGTTPDVQGFPFDVSGNCAATCGACGGGGGGAADCVDKLPSSPACEYGGLCDCAVVLAEHACGTEPEIGGFAFDVAAHCEKSCGCIMPADGVDSRPATCEMNRAIDAGRDLPIGPDCCFNIFNSKWTALFDWQLWTLTTDTPEATPRWVGIGGAGGPEVSWLATAVWENGGAWDDPLFGAKGGMVGAQIGLASVSQFLRAAELPAGYRMYLYDAGSPGPRDNAGYTIGVSDGESFVVVGRAQVGNRYDIMNPREITNATDPVIRANARWVEGVGFDSLADDALREWESPAGVRYFMMVRRVTDRAGLRWNLVVLIPREEVLREIERASSETRARIDLEQAETREEQDDAQVVMYVVAAGVFLFATSLVTVGWEALLASQIRELSGEMRDVAMMRVDSIDALSLSSIAEICSMQWSFGTMVGHLREYKQYLPQSCLPEFMDSDDDGCDYNDAASQRTKDERLRSIRTTECSEPPRRRTTRDSDASFHSASRQPIFSTLASTKIRDGDSRTHTTTCNVVPSGRGNVMKSGRGGNDDVTTPRNNDDKSPRYDKSPRKDSTGLRSISTHHTPPAGKKARQLAKRQATLVSANVSGYLRAASGGDRGIIEMQQILLSNLVWRVTQEKGITDGFSADRFYSSLNGVRQRAGHTSAGVRLAWAFAGSDADDDRCIDLMCVVPRAIQCTLSLHAAACSGHLFCGNLGCDGLMRYSFIGQAATWVHLLERMATRWGCVAAANGAAKIDAETTFVFRLRCAAAVGKPSHAGFLPQAVWQLVSPQQERDVDEWQYQLEEQSRADVWSYLNSALAAFYQADYAAAAARTAAGREDLQRRVAATALRASLPRAGRGAGIDPDTLQELQARYNEIDADAALCPTQPHCIVDEALLRKPYAARAGKLNENDAPAEAVARSLAVLTEEQRGGEAAAQRVRAAEAAEQHWRVQEAVQARQRKRAAAVLEGHKEQQGVPTPTASPKAQERASTQPQRDHPESPIKVISAQALPQQDELRGGVLSY